MQGVRRCGGWHYHMSNLAPHLRQLSTELPRPLKRVSIWLGPVSVPQLYYEQQSSLSSSRQIHALSGEAVSAFFVYVNGFSTFLTWADAIEDLVHEGRGWKEGCDLGLSTAQQWYKIFLQTAVNISSQSIARIVGTRHNYATATTVLYNLADG